MKRDRKGTVITCLPQELFPDHTDFDLSVVIRSIRKGIPVYVGGVSKGIGKVVPGDVIRLRVYVADNVGSEKYSLGEVIEKGYTEENNIAFCVEFNGGVNPGIGGRNIEAEEGKPRPIINPDNFGKIHIIAGDKEPYFS